MVVLINLFPWFVAVCCIVGAVKVKSIKWKLAIAVFFMAFAVIYPKVQPSYMPKGKIERSQIQYAEPSDAVVEDRNRKPVPSEERQAKQDEEYRKGAPSSER